jgi:chemotaxis protein methyltransferase CheR
VPEAVRQITPKEFTLFRALVHKEAGINLTEVKKPLLVGRLMRRLRELELRRFEDYYQLVERDPAERVRMIDSICTNETHFFREPRQFEFLAQQALPRWIAEAAAAKRPRRLRVWSAACSTGEEPYSLAMLLLDHLPPGSGWDVEVLASDLSSKALDRARAAVWPLEKSKEIPPAQLKRYMLRGSGPQEGRMKAGPEIRALVKFQRANLREDRYSVPGPFDLILCRNVLIYFDPPTKAHVVERLLGQLAVGGYLLLGHAESLTGQVGGVRSVGPNVYVHAPAAAGGGRP